jgi:hypothetical protein
MANELLDRSIRPIQYYLDELSPVHYDRHATVKQYFRYTHGVIGNMLSYFAFRLESLYLSIYEVLLSIAFPLWTLYIYLQHFSTGLRKPLTTFEGIEYHSYNARTIETYSLRRPYG